MRHAQPIFRWDRSLSHSGCGQSGSVSASTALHDSPHTSAKVRVSVFVRSFSSSTQSPGQKLLCYQPSSHSPPRLCFFFINTTSLSGSYSTSTNFFFRLPFFFLSADTSSSCSKSSSTHRDIQAPQDAAQKSRLMCWFLRAFHQPQPSRLPPRLQVSRD